MLTDFQEAIMKTYSSQNGRKELAVIILLSLILTSAIEAGEQNPCDTCGGQRTMQISRSNETSDSAGAATSIDNDRTKLSNKKLIEEYRISIESRIVGVISDMMAIFMVLALLCMLIIFIIK